MRAKNLIPLIILFTLISCFGSIFAQSPKDTLVVDFTTIHRTIQEEIGQYGAEDVLVVLDIDNTLLTGDTDLGSDVWYQWQNGELDPKPTEGQALTKDCLFNEAIGLLYELGTMSLTDSLLPEYVAGWQRSGATVIALTSRSPKYRAATERELQRNGIDLSAAQLRTIEGNTFSFHYTLGREVSYANGIFMTTGLHKGEMLDHLLDRSGRSFRAIIMADDGRKNIDAVKSAYASADNTEVILFHYTRIITDRVAENQGKILTPEQAQKMADDWTFLINTLLTIFPERLEKSDCLVRP